MKMSIQFISLCFLVFMAISCQQNEVLSPATNSSTTTISNNDNSITEANRAPSLSDLTAINQNPIPASGTCQIRLQGTWILSEVLDDAGNTTTCDMIYAHLPDTLKFTNEDEIRLDWVDATGFHLLDYTPNDSHECYHGMYKVNCTAHLLDIGQLYCSDPSPLAARCGPPQFGRFKIIRLSSNTIILDSYEMGWSTVDYYPIPLEGVQRFVFERL
ncbi:MAG: hypothetical protein ACI976_001632 [Aureispira sp.]|jgi:hypothetical protein